MSVRLRRSNWIYTVVVSWRQLAQRFSFILFLILAFGLLFLSSSKPMTVEKLRARAIDGMTPLLDLIARPMELTEVISQRVTSYINLRQENERLRAENAQMLHWRNTALAMENENRELRTLLNYKAEPPASYITARVIADTGGPFVRSLIVTVGREDGVRVGMAAMTGEGLIGRVIEAGDWSSRILLITDLNSRIPVTIMGSGEHAILAGDNTSRPKLLYLPQETILQQGARVITSGHGGVFPPELPVGVVAGMTHGEVEVIPLASIGKINQVRLVDFNLKGGALNPMSERIEAGASLR